MLNLESVDEVSFVLLKQHAILFANGMSGLGEIIACSHIHVGLTTVHLDEPVYVLITLDVDHVSLTSFAICRTSLKMRPCMDVHAVRMHNVTGYCIRSVAA